MAKVYLYGALKQRYGRVFEFDASTPAECVRALSANLEGFRAALVGHDAGFVIRAGREPLALGEVGNPLGKRSFHLVQLVAGAEKGAVGQILTGIAIVVASSYTFGAAAAAAGSGASATAWGAAHTFATSLGMSMVIGGVSGLLAQNPTGAGASERGGNPSYLFSGARNTYGQGHPVPLLYGRLRVGGACVSASIATVDRSPVAQDGTGYRITTPSTMSFSFAPGTGSDGSFSFVLETSEGNGASTFHVVSSPRWSLVGAIVSSDRLYDEGTHVLRFYATDESGASTAVREITVTVSGVSNTGETGGGFGGGGGGSVHTPVEAPDSLVSVAFARTLDVASEGEIFGFPESGPIDANYANPASPSYKGDKSGRYIYLDGTPLYTGDTPNFTDVRFDYRLGTQTQSAIPGFPSAESINEINVEVKKSISVTRVINDLNAGRGVVTLRYPALYRQEDNGDRNGVNVDCKIEVMASNGSWTTVVPAATVSGKQMGPYERSWSFDLVGVGPWQVRVSRTTADSLDVNLQDKSIWGYLTSQVDARLRYPNSAVFAVQVDAKQFSAVPQRSYELKGRLVKVPNNYNPETREYTGVWGGGWQVAWTDNPAWCFYDLLTNPRFGLGGNIAAAHIDKWALYGISKYCDELVPDGRGGMEPRFACNLYLQSREEAYRVIQHFASVFRGISYWASGMVTAVQDKPSDPLYQFTSANVIDGKFTYASSSRRSRHNVVLVTWIDPDDDYQPKVEYVEDAASIAKNGVLQTEIQAFGCTSRGQAARLGRWLIYSEQCETDAVSFKTGFEGCKIRPGEVFAISDPSRLGSRMGGRVVSGTASVLTLDAPVTLPANPSLSVTMPDGYVETKGVLGADGAEVTLSVPLSAAPLPNAVWTLHGTSRSLYRATSIKEADRHIYEIQAIAHDPAKYATVETGLKFEPTPTGGPVDPAKKKPGECVPDRPALSESLEIVSGAVVARLTATWGAVVGALSYKVQWRKGSGNWTFVDVAGSNWQIDGITPGAFEVRVSSVLANNLTSAWSPTAWFEALGKSAPPANVPNLTATVRQGAIELVWEPVLDLDLAHYQIRQSTTLAAEWSSMAVLDSQALNTRYQWARPATGTYKIGVVAVDTTGHPSTIPTFVTVSVSSLDDLLAKEQKPIWINKHAELVARKGAVDAAADARNVSRTAFDLAHSQLSDWLGTLTPAWNDVAEDTPLGVDGGTTLRSKFGAVEVQEGLVWKAIDAAAKAAEDAAADAAEDAYHKAPVILDSLPATPGVLYAGRLVYLRLDQGAQRKGFYRGSADGLTWELPSFIPSQLVGELVAGQIAAGAIGAAHIQADALRTSNYAEDGNGVPTAGAKLDKAGVAIKCAAGGLQVGGMIFDQRSAKIQRVRNGRFWVVDTGLIDKTELDGWEGTFWDQTGAVTYTPGTSGLCRTTSGGPNIGPRQAGEYSANLPSIKLFSGAAFDSQSTPSPHGSENLLTQVISLPNRYDAVEVPKLYLRRALALGGSGSGRVKIQMTSKYGAPVTIYDQTWTSSQSWGQIEIPLNETYSEDGYTKTGYHGADDYLLVVRLYLSCSAACSLELADLSLVA